MAYSKKYPQVYRGNNEACLMLDRTDGYILTDDITRITEVPSGMKRAEWTDLSLEEAQAFDGVFQERGIEKRVESLFELPEFIIVREVNGYIIRKRRVKRRRLPTYYVGEEGFKTLGEALKYVRSLPQTPNQS